MDAAEGSTSDEQQWARMGREQFVALTTYRKNGATVTTPVWIAADGDGLVVTSEAETGKVKRLRRGGSVRLQPCSRLGRTDPADPVVPGRGRVLGPEREHPGAVAALRRKYGVQFTIFLVVERLVRRLQRRDGARVIIRIEPGEGTP